MAASNVRAGGAFVELFVRDGAVAKSLEKVKKQLVAFGASIRNIGLGSLGLGTAITGPMLAAVKSFSSAGSELNDLSAQTGISTDSLQTLGYVASQTGSDSESLVGAIGKMQKALANDPKGMDESLARLGLTIDDLKGLSPDDQFRAIASGLARISDPAQRTGIAMQIFGKSAGGLIQMLALGGPGIAEMEDRLRRLGGVMSTEDVTAADELGDRMDDLFGSLGRVKNIIGAALAPLMTEMVKAMTDAVAAVVRWVNENRGLVIGLATVGSVLAAVGVGLIGIGSTIQIVGFAVGGFAKLWAMVGAAMSAVAASPMLLVLGGLAAITLAFQPLRQAAIDTFGFLFQNFGQLGEIVNETMGGISDALAGGDIQAAARVLWAGLYAAWLTGTEQLRAVYRQVVGNLASIGTDLFAGLRSAWVITTRFMADAWQVVIGGITGAWRTAQNTIAGGFARAIALVTGQDQSEVLATLTEMQDAEAAAAQSAFDRKMSDREKLAKQKLADIEAERQAQQDTLAEMRGEQESAAKAELEAARRELTDARKAAATARTSRLPGAPGTPAAGRAISELTAGFGSFSAAGANRIGISSVSPLQKPLEETANNTEEMVELLRKNEGQVFA